MSSGNEVVPLGVWIFECGGQDKCFEMCLFREIMFDCSRSHLTKYAVAEDILP